MKICWDNLEKIKINYMEESEFPCKVCNEFFLKRKNKNNEFCSKSCANTFTSARRKVSEETRKKISDSNKGKVISDETKKKISKKLVGTKHSDITKNKMSSSHRGENNYKWNGGYGSCLGKRDEVPYDKYSFLKEFHEIRRNNIDKDILETKCTYCGKWYKPKYYEAKNRKKSIYYKGDGGHNFYCSKECKSLCPIYRKTVEQLIKIDMIKSGLLQNLDTQREVQPELRKLVFERDNWLCVKCSSSSNLHCHHILPVSIEPIESADLHNCVTLCKECHKEVHRKEGCKNNELKNNSLQVNC
jgi:hypothetical protein